MTDERIFSASPLTLNKIVVLIVAMTFIRPCYNVWSQELEDKAEFVKPEQNRKIKIQEAKAILET